MCSTLNIRPENNLQSVALINLIEFNFPFLVLGVSELHMLTYVKQYANLYLEPRALQMFLITKKSLPRPWETWTTVISGLTPFSSSCLDAAFSCCAPLWLGCPIPAPNYIVWFLSEVPRNLHTTFSTLALQNLGSFPLLCCCSFSLSPSSPHPA